MKFTDYYQVLGLTPTATAEEIKLAYRKLARKYHPDVSKEPGTVKRFTDIGEANEALSDPLRRAAYDKLRAGGWTDGQEIETPPTREYRRSAGQDAGGTAGFSDFFQSMFGEAAAGGRRRRPSRSAYSERGDDLQYAISVTLEESYRGCEREFTVQTPTISDHGEVTVSTRSISVKIPKGVMQGSKIRLRGQGHPGSSSARNGDLFLDVVLAAHQRYRVDGHDVSLEVPIAPWEAVLGGQIEVPTLGGTVTATIPAGIQHGQKLRLKGRGLPADPPGDQYLSLHIVVPTSATETVKELYRTLGKASAFDPRALFMD